MSAVTLGCPCNDDEAVSFRHSDFVTGRRNCGKKWCPERISFAESGCDSFVAMVQTTDLRDFNDPSVPELLNRPADRCVLAQR